MRQERKQVMISEKTSEGIINALLAGVVLAVIVVFFGLIVLTAAKPSL